MSQNLEVSQEQDSVHPIVALKAAWLNDARQMLVLRRLHLAQEWNIPLSLITDPALPPPPPITVNQTTSRSGSLASGLLGAALTLGAGGTAFGLFQALKPAIERVIPGINTDTTVNAGQTFVE